MTLTLDALDAEAARLILPRFDEASALRLGLILVDLAKGLPVVINIRNAHRTFFHAALPGSQAGNDNWARRKSNTVLMTGRASMAVGLKNAERKRTLATDGLAEADYADHGGAVPIMVEGVGMVAVATVSGLPQEDDHRLVVRGLEGLLAAPN
jgi:uncharacterized protein (UPF0303 family)